MEKKTTFMREDATFHRTRDDERVEAGAIAWGCCGHSLRLDDAEEHSEMRSGVDAGHLGQKSVCLLRAGPRGDVSPPIGLPSNCWEQGCGALGWRGRPHVSDDI